MRDQQLMINYRTEKSVGLMEKREINTLEPYLDRRTTFTWLPQSNIEYYTSALADKKLRFQNRRDLTNVSDYLTWSIGNFVLFFVIGILCIILSVRVREHKQNDDYESASKLSRRAFILNSFTSLIGICFFITMLAILINKSSTHF